ncbi:MAG: penicillin-binding protein 2 [Candidatus Kapaibacteriales bacterium]
MNGQITAFNQDFASTHRFKIMVALLLGIGCLFVARLFKLQLLDFSEYSEKAQTQAIKNIEVKPFRGKIFDRNGILFLHNAPSFSVTLTKKDFDPEAMPLLADLLKMRESEIDSIINQYKSYRFLPIKIAKDVEMETVSLIEEYKDYMPGVEVQSDFKRLYDFEGNMAHMLGYTREINREELEKMPWYKPGDMIGKNGLEKSYEEELSGKSGYKMIAVNKLGEKMYDYEQGEKDIQPNNGFDLHLAIDMNLQKVAENALGDNRGSVVAIDPRDGSILVFISKPDYDPRKFTGRVSPKFYDSLRMDPGKPLAHRAIQSGYPPGSAWKMLVAIAALEEGIISEKSTYQCNGGVSYGGRFAKCMGVHGSISVKTAIKKSCNSFFYNCGIKLGVKKMIEWGESFGFGKKTDVDLPNELGGTYYSYENLKKRHGGKVYGGTALNYGIGQGEVSVTPLQMAHYVMLLANSGQDHEPHLVKYIYNNVLEKKLPLGFKTEQFKGPDGKPVSQKTWDIVREGMWKVVNEGGGTGGRARLDSVFVAGKTSTAQNPHGKPHAWFVSFAPYDNPEIAMAVIVENVGGGGSNAAPVARQILDSYFNPEAMYYYVPELRERRDSIRRANKRFNLIQTDSLNLDAASNN